MRELSTSQYNTPLIQELLIQNLIRINLSSYGILFRFEHLTLGYE